jgi:hypothetical protein
VDLHGQLPWLERYEQARGSTPGAHPTRYSGFTRRAVDVDGIRAIISVLSLSTLKMIFG